MSGMRGGQILAHLDKTLDDNIPPSSNITSTKQQQKSTSPSTSSPSSHASAAAVLPAPTVPHDREQEEENKNNNKKSLFSSLRSSSHNSATTTTTKASTSKGLLHSFSSKKEDKEQKDISQMISTSLMTTGVLLGTPGGVGTIGQGHGRDRSSSSASQQSIKSNKNSSNNIVEDRSATPLNHSINNASSTSLQSQQLQQQQQSNHHHHHIRLPTLHSPFFFKRRKQDSTATGSLDSLTSSSSSLPRPSSSSLLKPASAPHPHHTILMVPQHDIHITYPHSVPSQNVFIAGTWTVPGHNPWEKLAMTFNPETNSFEIQLNVQELEDISDYLDDEGYLHHELLGHPDEEEPHSSEAHNSTTETTTTTPHLSKRQRVRRFFGRARSSSSASTTSAHSQDRATNNNHSHEDTAYHHQCKDGGAPLPLTKEYRYQYKFVIDDNWCCDEERPQIHDGHGHWNHELVVVLMERIAPYPSSSVTGDNEYLVNRSRSSSIQSVNAAATAASSYSKPLPALVVEVSEPQSEQELVEEDETLRMTSNEPKAVALESDGKISTAAGAAAVEVVGTSFTKSSANPRDTYEAILLFEERDDLSDGEGRSKEQYAITSEDEDEDHDDNEHGPDAPEQNHSIGHTAEEEDKKEEEDDKADQDIGSAIIGIVDVDTTFDSNVGESLVESDVEQSLAVEEKDESIVDSTMSKVVEQENVEEKEEIEKEKDEKTDFESSSLSEGKSGTVEVEAATGATAITTATPFVLMEAADPEKQSRASSTSVLEGYEGEQEDEVQEAKIVPTMQIVTNTSSFPSPVAYYPQVPSPPLTPLRLSMINVDTEVTPTGMLSPQSDDGDETKMMTKELPTAATFMEASALLTPRAETSSFTKVSYEQETKYSLQEAETAVAEIQEKQEPQVQFVPERRTTVREEEENENETFDVLDDHSSLKSSSSTSSMRTVETSTSRHEENQQPRRDLPRPDKYPNLLWSFCKTTVVVSAAVVVIGLGLGRKRD